MRLQIKSNQRTLDVDRKEVKRSSSTTQFQNKDKKYYHAHQENNNNNVPSQRYFEGIVKHSSPPVLSYNQSVQSLQSLHKSDENSSKSSLVFQNVDQNIQNNRGVSGLHLHTPSMDKELKNLTQKLAIERTEIEQELKKTKSEAVKWKDKYDQLIKNQQKQHSGGNIKNTPVIQDNENSIHDYQDFNGNYTKNYIDLSSNIQSMNAFGNTTKSQALANDKEMKLLAQKFAMERVGLENQIKDLQMNTVDLENKVQANQIENMNLKHMCEEIEKQKQEEISDFKKKLQENELELKKNIQQEFIKLGDTFTKEKSSLEKKIVKYEEEIYQLQRENQTLIDSIHSLNSKNKSQNDLISNLSSNKQEQNLLFEKVSYLEQELQYITEQFLKEQENKQALSDRINLEKNKSDTLNNQLDEQKRNFDKLSSSSKEINNKFQEILNQLKYEQQRSEQLEMENENLQYQLNEMKVFPNESQTDYKLKYEDQKEKNVDLLEQVDQQRQLIAQMKEQIDILGEFSKNITSNAQLNSQTNDQQKIEYQRQIQYYQQALKTLQSKLALKLRILKKTYMLLLCDVHLKNKLSDAENNLKAKDIRIGVLEQNLFDMQRELGEYQGKLGVCEMELTNKKKETLEKQNIIFNLEEKIKEKQFGDTNSYELQNLKIQIQRMQNRINEQEDDNKSLSEQNNLTEQLLSKMRQQLSIKEQEFNNIQQQFNMFKVQQSYQEDLTMNQKKIDEQKKLIEQNKNKMTDLLKIIEDKDKLISELQFDLKIKNEEIHTHEDFTLKKIDTEKSEINIRNLETVYEQRITQLQQDKSLEIERYVNLIKQKSSEIQILSEKNDDYLVKMDILSTELENLQTVINQKQAQITVLNQQIQDIQLSQLQGHSYNYSDPFTRQNEFDSRLSKTQNIPFHIHSDSTQGSLMQSQLQTLKIEHQQSKVDMEKKIQEGENEIQELKKIIKNKSIEIEVKNEEIRKLIGAQSQSLVVSFSKDSQLNQKNEDISNLNKRIMQLEDEKKELQLQLIKEQTTLQNVQPQIIEQQQKINETMQIIQSQKEQIQELTLNSSKYVQVNSQSSLSNRDSRNYKNLTDLEINKSVTNSLANMEYDVQVSKLKREVQQLTKLCESQESSLKVIQADSNALKKELEDTKEKYKNTEFNLSNLKGHIIQITQNNEKLVKRIEELQETNKMSRKNSINPITNQHISTEFSLENYSREIEGQKQGYVKQIQDLTFKIEKCQQDKFLLSQEIEILRDTVRQKEKQIDSLKDEIKLKSSQSELGQNFKLQPSNFSNEKLYLEEKIKQLEQQNHSLKNQQPVIIDGKLRY